jgi:hypothetical protein
LVLSEIIPKTTSFLNDLVSLIEVEFYKLNTYFSVVLKGGNSSKEGNVFVLNRETKLFGPVCDDYWSFNDVRKVLKVFGHF